MGCHFLLQGIFLTQGSNLGLPHCRQMLYRLCHQGSQPVNPAIPGTKAAGNDLIMPQKERRAFLPAVCGWCWVKRGKIGLVLLLLFFFLNCTELVPWSQDIQDKYWSEYTCAFHAVSHRTFIKNLVMYKMGNHRASLTTQCKLPMPCLLLPPRGTASSQCPLLPASFLTVLLPRELRVEMRLSSSATPWGSH